jgi:hypothetical protein
MVGRLNHGDMAVHITVFYKTIGVFVNMGNPVTFLAASN